LPSCSNRFARLGSCGPKRHEKRCNGTANGAKKALIPLENKRSFLEVTGDIVEHVDPIFFGDPKTAAFKALGLN
jgi:hypothetical protein